MKEISLFSPPSAHVFLYTLAIWDLYLFLCNMRYVCFCCFTSFHHDANAELVLGIIIHHKKDNYVLDFPALSLLPHNYYFTLFFLVLNVWLHKLSVSDHKGTKVFLCFPLSAVGSSDTNGWRVLQSFNMVVLQSMHEYSKCRQVEMVKNLDSTGPDL